MSGYTGCACRDCFDISMNDTLCAYCEESGCSEHDGECCRDDAYGAHEPDNIRAEIAEVALRLASVETTAHRLHQQTADVDAARAGVDETAHRLHQQTADVKAAKARLQAYNTHLVALLAEVS